MNRLVKYRPSPPMAVAVLALFVALAGTTYAATGGTFILGQSNSATSQTGLTSSNAGKALNVTQQSTGTGATALGLNVPTGKTPFTVNSGVKVVNLNADRIDGIDSSGFLRKSAKAADSDKLDGIDSTGFYAAGSKVADSIHADSATNADALNGKTAAQLQGARAFALAGGPLCPGTAVVFCPVVRGKGVGYVVKVALGTYCVGVTGINAAAADSAAIVSASYAAGNAIWSYSNSACDAAEFEIYTVVENTNGQIANRSDAMAFTIAIP